MQIKFLWEYNTPGRHGITPGTYDADDPFIRDFWQGAVAVGAAEVVIEEAPAVEPEPEPAAEEEASKQRRGRK